MKMTLGNYPAPLKIIEVLKKSVASKALNKPKGYDIEADGFSDLCITPQSQGLQAITKPLPLLTKPLPVLTKPLLVAGALLCANGYQEESVQEPQAGQAGRRAGCGADGRRDCRGDR